jgi:hypothetical protein
MLVVAVVRLMILMVLLVDQAVAAQDHMVLVAVMVHLTLVVEVVEEILEAHKI